MRVMLLAFLATAVIAVVAWYGLQNAGFSTAQETAGPNVRLD